MNLRTKLLVGFCVLLAAALGGNYLLLASVGRHVLVRHATRRAESLTTVLARVGNYSLGVEEKAEWLLGEQMLAQAVLASHFVDVAENKARLSTEEINARLGQIADSTVIDEFWITDETGHAYLRNLEEIDFTFPLEASSRNQAHHFRQVLESRDGQLVQRVMEREHDGQIFKYGAVSGIDRPRIVQVGFNAASLKKFSAGITADELGHEIAGNGGILRLRAVGRDGLLYLDTARPGPPEPGTRPHEPALMDMVHRALDESASQTRVQGQKILVASPTLTSEGENYVLLTTFDARPYYATRRVTMLTLAVGSIILLGAGVFLALRFSGQIALPIQKLAAEAEQIGSGQLDRTVDVRGGKEVNLLADSFNRMTRSLTDHIEELKQITAEKERMESDLRTAARVQSWMLPGRLPEVRGLQVSVNTKPAREVGGDFYDFIHLPTGNLCLVLGDASGKGLPAALFGAQSLTAIRTLAPHSRSVSDILVGANGLLVSSGGQGGMFATVFCGTLSRGNDRLSFVNAGHCRPVAIGSFGPPQFLTFESSLPVGLVEDYGAVEQQCEISPGELLLFYSDGVTDAQNRNGEMFGKERLLDCLSTDGIETPDEAIQRVTAAVEDFSGGAEPSDDMTMLAFRRT